MSESSHEQKLFEWDFEKAQTNLLKHGVSFEEAKTVFSDQYAKRSFDPKHSQEEERFLLLGKSRSTNRILLVWFTKRDGRRRLIGARKTSSREKDEYEQFQRDLPKR